MSPQTAMRAFQRLQERGFITSVTKGTFSRKARHASEWRLTEHPCDVTGEMATKAFMVLEALHASHKNKTRYLWWNKQFPWWNSRYLWWNSNMLKKGLTVSLVEQ